MTNPDEIVPAGLGRRFGAMLYDALLVVAVLIAITFCFVPFLDGRVLVPQEVGALAYFYWLLELAAVVLFFGYFWTRRGQTVGMLAWRLRLEQSSGENVTWGIALKRMAILVALLVPYFLGYWLIWEDWPKEQRRWPEVLTLLPLGIVYAWAWFDGERRTLHDRWTNTRVRLLPRKK